MIQAKLGMLDPNQRLVRNEDEFKGKGFYEDDSCKHSWLAEGGCLPWHFSPQETCDLCLLFQDSMKCLQLTYHDRGLVN